MATETWIRFVHAWHTLGVVLKWMCITVVGIPVAIATCLVVALAALIFFALVLLTAAAILFGLYWLIRGSIMLLMRAPESFTEWLRVRADKRLLPLSEREKIPVHDPWNIGRISRRAARERHPPVQPVPAGYDDIEGQLQVPQAVHLAEERLPDSQIPASNIPGSNADLWRCEVCFEDKNRTEFPARVVTNTCQHGTLHCCNECLAQTITTAFEGNIWNDIRCPVCNEQLEHKDIAEFAPREIFER
ncbi:hypothetical protein G7Y89_g7514 [Cudoniella acicularis]|uniref:RING-type domain-containing protein n=1 Tax=Cudoniella acicularis TaxID=354080 RepID=A0A8H4RKM7_9HELO|nr:hypothetical protein G7Y89_g7514 [Cudoniella acicularis]